MFGVPIDHSPAVCAGAAISTTDAAFIDCFPTKETRHAITAPTARIPKAFVRKRNTFGALVRKKTCFASLGSQSTIILGRNAVLIGSRVGVRPTLLTLIEFQATVCDTVTAFARGVASTADTEGVIR